MNIFTNRPAILAAAALTAFSFSGCGEKDADAEHRSRKEQTTWVNHGQGVYTTSFANLPDKLVKFREQNPDMTITSIYASKECAQGGHTTGVVFVADNKAQ